MLSLFASSSDIVSLLAILVLIMFTHQAKIQEEEGCMVQKDDLTKKSTSSFSTSFSDSSDNSFSCIEVKFSTGKVIKEEEGFCSLCQNIIYTHCNQILTNGIMLVALLGNLWKYKMHVHIIE